MLAKEKIKTYRTANGINNLLDMYADDLQVYFEYNKGNNWNNKENVRRVLDVMNKLYLWSGLKINLDKTYMTIFGKVQKKYAFVDELKIKCCVEFKLLGIYFDSMQSNMQRNYQKAIENVKGELHSWKYRFFTLFGKITVIKTMNLPILNHIVMVVPNLN